MCFNDVESAASAVGPEAFVGQGVDEDVGKIWSAMDFWSCCWTVVVSNAEAAGCVVGLEAVAGLGVDASVEVAVSRWDMKLFLG